VFTGTHQLKFSKEDEQMQTKVFKPDEIIVHENYSFIRINRTDHNFDYDVALVSCVFGIVLKFVRNVICEKLQIHLLIEDYFTPRYVSPRTRSSFLLRQSPI